MLLAMSNYLVTVPGFGLFDVLASDRAAALAGVAADVWHSSGGTVTVDTRFCAVQTAISLADGVELFR